MKRTAIARFSLIAVAMRATLAGVLALAATAGPAVADPLTLLTYIPVPADAANVQPGGAFSSFDISFADPVTGNIFIADRSNASVDIFSGSSLTFLGRATGFTGQQATTSVSGPDGVVTVSSGATHSLFAGDGNSTLKSFNVSNPAAPTTLFPPLNTGGSFRVDEMAYSPSANLVLAANNADGPAFGTLVNASTGAAVASHIVVPGAIGLEQPVWNPNTGTFFISVPAFNNSSNPGGVAEIKTDGTIGRIYDFASFGITSCSPTGLALGASGNLLVGCGNVGAAAILLNPAGAGSIVKTFAGLGGTDELWYDPTTAEFYVTGNNGTNATRFFDVLTDDALGGTITQTVDLPTTTSAHSITVDPFNGDVFVPLAGTSAVNPCPASFANPGCIAVFAQNVPEPGTLPILATALLCLAGVRMWRRRVRREF